MAYKKTYRKKRTTRRKKGSNGSALVLARKALSIAKTMRPETKHYSLSLLFQPADVAANIGYQMPVMVQGNGQNERVGDDVYLKSMSIKGIISRGAAVTSQIRVIIFKGKSEDQKTYTIGTDLLEDVPYVYSIKKQDEKYNTKFLYDKVFTFDSVKTNIVNFDFSIKLGWFCHFTEALTTIRDSGVYIAVVSNQPTAANAPILNWNIDTFYTDA